jgi:hypothetical protein
VFFVEITGRFHNVRDDCAYYDGTEHGKYRADRRTYILTAIKQEKVGYGKRESREYDKGIIQALSELFLVHFYSFLFGIMDSNFILAQHLLFVKK